MNTLYNTVALFLPSANILNCAELHSKEQMLVDWHVNLIVLASIMLHEEPAKRSIGWIRMEQLFKRISAFVNIKHNRWILFVELD